MEILPFLSFLLMIGLYNGSWRERFILASVTWGVIVLMMTELVSLWHGLDRMGLAVAWSLVLLVLAVRCWMFRPSGQGPWGIFQFKTATIVFMLFGILGVTGLIAFYAAPNNWDSMTYHLARVAHWAQDKTIAMYPTSNLRQIIYPPWSSYAVTQFYILAGCDRWVNFIQWFSSLGCMIGVSLIAVRLKAGVFIQAFAALITATIPMGILQSTSTQNDYVAAFWLVCFVYFGMGLLQEARWRYSLACAFSLGLAWLVKGIGYIYAAPFLMWICLGGLKNYGRKFLFHLAAIVVIAVLLNSSYYVRNFSLLGNVVPPSESEHILGHSLDFKVMIANLVLNMGLHAATVWDKPNRWVEGVVDQVLNWAQIKEGDKRLYLEGMPFKILDPTFRYHEDYAGNFIHSLLILICLSAGFLMRHRMSHDCKYYAITMLGAIIIFVIMIKWSPFHSRYHLPVFVLFAPLVAVVIGFCLRSEGVIILLAAVLTLASIPWLVGNKSRPLQGNRNILTVGRMDQYFFNSPPEAMDVYALGTAAQFNCRQIGLVFGSDNWEYPFNVISQWQKLHDIRFERIMVDNVSAKLEYPLGAFDPCMIIEKGDKAEDVLNWQGHAFAKVSQKGTVITYLRVN